MLNSMTRLVTHFTLEIKQSVTPVKSMAALEEELSKLLNPTPVFKDPEDYSDEETGAKLVDYADDLGDSEHFVTGTGDLRKKNLPILADLDNKYAGKRTSRKDLEEIEHTFYGDESEDKTAADDDEDDDDDDDTTREETDDSEASSSEDEKITDFQNKMKLTSSQKEFSFQDDGDYGKYGEDDYSEDESQGSHVSDSDFDGGGSDLDPGGSDLDPEDRDDRGKINDYEEEITSEEDEGIQKFSTAGGDDVAKGNAAKQQLGLWDSLLEGRIKLQKAASIINQLPQPESWSNFEEKAQNFTEESVKTQRALKHILDSLIHLQDILLYQNSETKHLASDGVKNKTEGSKQQAPADTDDEEIPSDSDEEMVGKRHTTDSKPEVKVGKRKFKTEDYPGFLVKRHREFQDYRDETIQRWNDKTQLFGGKIKGKSFSAFEQSALKQIKQILGDKDRLIKRTQLKRSQYKVLGKSDVQKSPTYLDETREDNPVNQEHVKDYDTETFDDSDFYHQLLRELIEKKTSDSNDPVEWSRQWLEIQKLRGKTKKKVDNKASKGRKVRYDVHSKLVNFMAPMDTCDWSDEARDDLFKSVFGKRFATLAR